MCLFLLHRTICFVALLLLVVFSFLALELIKEVSMILPFFVPLSTAAFEFVSHFQHKGLLGPKVKTKIAEKTQQNAICRPVWNLINVSFMSYSTRVKLRNCRRTLFTIFWLGISYREIQIENSQSLLQKTNKSFFLWYVTKTVMQCVQK